MIYVAPTIRSISRERTPCCTESVWYSFFRSSVTFCNILTQSFHSHRSAITSAYEAHLKHSSHPASLTARLRNPLAQQIDLSRKPVRPVERRHRSSRLPMPSVDVTRKLSLGEVIIKSPFRGLVYVRR